jgi:hypothetical protein
MSTAIPIIIIVIISIGMYIFLIIRKRNIVYKCPVCARKEPRWLCRCLDCWGWSPPTPVSKPLQNSVPIQTPPESQPAMDVDTTDSIPFISQSAMDAAFVAILQKMAAERGFSVFENYAKCKSLLQDYTAGEYKKESRLLLLAIEAGCSGEIARSTEREITRKKLITKLHHEFSIDKIAVEQIVDLLYSIYTG